MSTQTGIAWTQSTWNPLTGCSRVSSGCAHCYAIKDVWRMSHHPNETIAQANHGLVERHANGHLDWTGVVRFHPQRLSMPLHWKKPRRIFVNSLSDLCAEGVDPAWFDAMLTVMLLAPQHRFQVLTKRPERLYRHLTDPTLSARVLACAESYRAAIPHLCGVGISDPPWMPAPWIWWGVSVEDQATADARIPWLQQTPAAVRFVSYEPALGPVDFAAWLYLNHRCASRGPRPEAFRCGLWKDHGPRPHSALIPTGAPWLRRPALDWIICGGESGPEARCTPIAWLRRVVQQCQAAGVACFVKQLGRRPFWDGYGHIGADHLHTQPGMLDGVDGYVLDCYRDREGRNPEEWPEDLRVQEWPEDGTPFE